jgi:hypothetical protein
MENPNILKKKKPGSIINAAICGAMLFVIPPLSLDLFLVYMRHHTREDFPWKGELYLALAIFSIPRIIFTSITGIMLSAHIVNGVLGAALFAVGCAIRNRASKPH